MKVPLRYQITEYDCCPTSILNGLSYLFERKEIQPEVVRNVNLYCLDTYGDNGLCGMKGTTHTAMRFLTEWLDRFGKTGRLALSARYIAREEVTLRDGGPLAETLQGGGCAVARIDLDGWHYVLLTGLDRDSVYLFDPYILPEPFPVKGVRVIRDHEEEYNRIVPRESFSTEDVHPYSFGPFKTREAMLLQRITGEPE